MSARRKRHIRYFLFSVVPVVLIAMVVLPAVLSAAPAPDSPSAGATAKGCTECHDDTTLITGRHTEWETSLHATGTAYLRGTSASCAGCHSGGAFSLRVAAGLNPDQVTQGDPHPTRQDCRACHQIHVTYSGMDWALETTSPVPMFAIAGTPTYDGGMGNLCANCHQARRDAPVAEDGVITGISTHWGPHHGPQSNMMLGNAGVTEYAGTSSGHYNYVQDTCVGCHMEPNGVHTYQPNVAVCQGCHEGANNFDINGFQTLTEERLNTIGAELVSLGYLSSNDEDGHPTTSSAPENIGKALWNWLYIAHEDKSLGVHNPGYTTMMLDEACSQLGLSPC